VVDLGAGQVSQQAVGPALGWGPAWPGGGYPGGAWICLGRRGEDHTLCGSGAELWPGAARGVESLAQ
jgi:hypothetical protein